MITGTFLGLATVITSRFNPPEFNQQLLDKKEAIEVMDGRKGCGTMGFVASHNYKTIGMRINLLDVGDVVKYRGCKYKVVAKTVVKNSVVGYTKALKKNMLNLQTCYVEDGKTVFVYAVYVKK